MLKNRRVTSQDKPASRTERQQQRTRRQLLDAGRSLIAAKGVAGLRIQEITEAADVALGSFYNYFESKEAFGAAILHNAKARAYTTLGFRVGDGLETVPWGVEHQVRLGA